MPDDGPPLTIDLNSDVGEGFGAWTMGEDDALLALVTSANVACGFHAGDAPIMRRTCEVAVGRGVRIGAHVGYRDLSGFGRRAIDVPADQVRDEATYQVAALDAFARAAGDRVRYVKPHGALYHAACADPEIASALARAAAAFSVETGAGVGVGVGVGSGTGLALLGPAGSAMQDAALAAGLPFHAEGFADRAYLASGSLAPRRVAGSVLGQEAARAQATSIAVRSTAAVLDPDAAGREGSDGAEGSGGPGSSAAEAATVTVRARSLCVHSDSPGAPAIARAVREALTAAGVRIEAFS